MEQATKRTPYWHPQFPTPDGRSSCAAERRDIARLLCEARKERRVYRTRDCHDALWYVLHPFKGAPCESGRVFMPKHTARA